MFKYIGILLKIGNNNVHKKIVILIIINCASNKELWFGKATI
jgi:hypothetical protein